MHLLSKPANKQATRLVLSIACGLPSAYFSTAPRVMKTSQLRFCKDFKVITSKDWPVATLTGLGFCKLQSFPKGRGTNLHLSLQPAFPHSAKTHEAGHLQSNAVSFIFYHKWKYLGMCNALSTGSPTHDNTYLRCWRQETGRGKEVGEEEGFWEKSVINIYIQCLRSWGMWVWGKPRLQKEQSWELSWHSLSKNQYPISEEAMTLLAIGKPQ